MSNLFNATLQRVDAPPGTAPGGDMAAYTAGAALNVRCVMDSPTFLIQRQIDAQKLESTAVLYVQLKQMPTAASVLLRNAQVLVQQDGCPALLLRIDQADPHVFGGLSHLQCLVRAA